MFSLNTRVSVHHRSIALRSVPSEQRCVPADDFHFAPLRSVPLRCVPLWVSPLWSVLCSRANNKVRTATGPRQSLRPRRSTPLHSTPLHCATFQSSTSTPLVSLHATPLHSAICFHETHHQDFTAQLFNRATPSTCLSHIHVLQTSETQPPPASLA